MLPFSIMNQYANILPSTDLIQKVVSTADSIHVLSTTGNLYSIGNAAAAGVGSTTALTTWTLSNTNVSDMWTYQGNATRSLLILKNDSTWWSTGSQTFMVGSGSSTTWVDRTSFMNAAFTSSGSSYRNIIISPTNIVVLLQNGDLWISGTNASGQIGDGTTTTKTVLTKSSKTGISYIAASSGPNIYCATSTGTLYGAGANNLYQLNTTSTTGNITSFSTVTTGCLGVWTGDNYSSSSCVLYVLKSDGLYGAGSNSGGEQGYAVNSSRNLMTKISTLQPVNCITGINNVHLILSDGTTYFAGSNNYASGLGSTANIVSFTRTPAFDNSNYISHGRDLRAYLVRGNILYGCGTYNSTYNLIPNNISSLTTLTNLNVDNIT